MKKLKKAFTLAELLLCIGIIGVVSAMGMTIAKHGADRAYNLFYYNGYINLYNAIADAKAVNSEVSNSQIMLHVKDVLDIDGEDENNDEPGEIPPAAGWVLPGAANAEEVITANGVKYYYSKNLSDGFNGVGAVAGATNAIPITMTVPQRKTRANNGFATIRLAYVDADNGYLIPVVAGSTVNLQLRRDLLPAYIDNGIVGRNNVINRNGFEFQAIPYSNYRDAFCTVRNGSSLGTLINCTGYSIVPPREGILKIADPRKAR